MSNGGKKISQIPSEVIWKSHLKCSNRTKQNIVIMQKPQPKWITGHLHTDLVNHGTNSSDLHRNTHEKCWDNWKVKYSKSYAWRAQFACLKRKHWVDGLLVSAKQFTNRPSSTGALFLFVFGLALPNGFKWKWKCSLPWEIAYKWRISVFTFFQKWMYVATVTAFFIRRHYTHAHISLCRSVRRQDK